MVEWPKSVQRLEDEMTVAEWQDGRSILKSWEEPGFSWHSSVEIDTAKERVSEIGLWKTIKILRRLNFKNRMIFYNNQHYFRMS